MINIVADAIAYFKLPHDIFKNNEIGNVSVLILVAPAIIKAAPNSPKARAQVMIIPAVKPLLASGSVILKKV